METLERSACKPSGFPEYDELTGYVTRTYQTEWKDVHGNLWRKTCIVINLGKPDRGTVVDPDVQVQPEKLTDYKGAEVKRAPMGATLRRYVTILTEHGPQTMNRLAEMTGTLPQSVRISIEYHREMFVKVGEVMGGRGKMAAVWGLVGVHDAKEAA